MPGDFYTQWTRRVAQIFRMESRFHTFWIKLDKTTDGRRVYCLYCKGDRYLIEFVYDKYTDARLALRAFLSLKGPTISFNPGDIREEYKSVDNLYPLES